MSGGQRTTPAPLRLLLVVGLFLAGTGCSLFSLMTQPTGETKVLVDLPGLDPTFSVHVSSYNAKAGQVTVRVQDSHGSNKRIKCFTSKELRGLSSKSAAAKKVVELCGRTTKPKTYLALMADFGVGTQDAAAASSSVDAGVPERARRVRTATPLHNVGFMPEGFQEAGKEAELHAARCSGSYSSMHFQEQRSICDAIFEAQQCLPQPEPLDVEEQVTNVTKGLGELVGGLSAEIDKLKAELITERKRTAGFKRQKTVRETRKAVEVQGDWEGEAGWDRTASDDTIRKHGKFGDDFARLFRSISSERIDDANRVIRFLIIDSTTAF